MKPTLIFLALLPLAACTKDDRALIKAVATDAVDADHEDVYAEVANGNPSEASQLMMWALRSDYRYKWVELRWKDKEGKVLLVVRHTKPKPETK